MALAPQKHAKKPLEARIRTFRHRHGPRAGFRREAPKAGLESRATAPQAPSGHHIATCSHCEPGRRTVQI